jgi:DNA-binding PadR family transcriptional regulator
MSDGESGRKRKYYQITKSGKKQLTDKKEEWLIFSKTVNKVIGGSSYAL